MNDLLLALLLSTLLAALAAVQRALTPKGLLLAWIGAVIITFYGGITGFAILSATFLCTVLAGKIGKHRRSFEKSVHAKTGTRDALQVFCNIGVGSLLLLAGGLFHIPSMALAYGAVMAASLSDSLASELGVLSRAVPVDICTLKKTQRGLSGGVSLLGLGASLLGAAIIAAIYCVGKGGNLPAFCFITLCGFVGALADSICGSLLQVKYRCSVCSMMTEKTIHCEAPALRVKGFPMITNDTVNLMCNIFVGILAVVLLHFL